MGNRIISTDRKILQFIGEAPILAATVRLTRACNLRCRHCYVNAGNKANNELSLKEIKSIVDQLAKLKTFYIFFTGGEPFLRKDIVEILQYTNKKRIGISISTNGTIINEKHFDNIRNIPFNLFQISLDGPSETHDSIRGKGVWKNAVKTISLAKSKLRKNVGIGAVIMKDNCKVLDKIIIEGSAAGADKITLLCPILTGRADESINPSPAEFVDSLHLVFDRFKTLQSRIQFAKDTTVPSALIPEEWRKEGLHATFAPCSFPYYIAVDTNGDVAPCDGLFNNPEMIIGNIRKNNISDIWKNSKLLNELRKINPSDLKGVCKKCIYKNYCAGGCRAHAYIKYKDFTMPDPVCQSVYEAGLFPKKCLE